MPDKLEHLKAIILDKVTAAASGGDLASVAKWSEAAKECDQLTKEAHTLKLRVNAFEKSVHHYLEEPTQLIEATHPKEQDDGVGSLLSAKAEGEQARADWVKDLHTAWGIDLAGHGTRYRTATQSSVGIAFANENADRPDKWFLGLPDKPTDIVVLLCRTLDQKMHDLVLPMAELGDVWEKFTRSNGQVKFHVEWKGDELLLRVRGSQPLTVAMYKGDYQPLQ